MFLTFFNLILKFFEIQLKLITFFLENLIQFFDFIGNLLFCSFMYLIACPGCGYRFILYKFSKKFRTEKAMNRETNNININSIVLNQKLENNELKILCQKNLINELNQKISSLNQVSNPNLSNSGNFNSGLDFQNMSNQKMDNPISFVQTSNAVLESESNLQETEIKIEDIGSEDELHEIQEFGENNNLIKKSENNLNTC